MEKVLMAQGSLFIYQYQLKTKFGMYFAQPSFCIFEWCVGFAFRNSRESGTLKVR